MPFEAQVMGRSKLLCSKQKLPFQRFYLADVSDQDSYQILYVANELREQQTYSKRDKRSGRFLVNADTMSKTSKQTINLCGLNPTSSFHKPWLPGLHWQLALEFTLRSENIGRNVFNGRILFEFGTFFVLPHIHKTDCRLHKLKPEDDFDPRPCLVKLFYRAANAGY